MDFLKKWTVPETVSVLFTVEYESAIMNLLVFAM